MEDKQQRNRSWFVTVVLVIAAIAFIVIGCVMASNRIPAERAGYMTGQLLIYGITLALVMGAILRAIRIPHAWAVGSCATAFFFMLALIGFSGMAAKSDVQVMKSEAAMKALIADCAGVRAMVAVDYPKSDYGRFASVLTAMRRDLTEIQKKRFALEAKQKQAGSLAFDSPGVYADETKRTAELENVALLRALNTGTAQLEQDLLNAVHMDVESSELTDKEKHDFLRNFDESGKLYADELDAIIKLALQIDGLDEDMVKIAAKDHPRLIDGHLLFNSKDALARFQTDEANARALAAQLLQLRSQYLQQRADVLKTYNPT